MFGNSYNTDELARQSLQSLTQMSQRGTQFQPNGQASTYTTNGTIIAAGSARSDSQPFIGPARPEDLMTMAISQAQSQQQSPTAADQSIQQSGSVEWFNHEGLEVLTVGHIMPRVGSGSPVENFPSGNASVASQLNGDLEVEEQVMPTGVPQPTVNSNGVIGGPRLRVRRRTYVPGWAVPPRVLLVEDDAVSRKLSSKFLQVLGVTTDFAVDGESAVKQMHIGHYDLVLMVRCLASAVRSVARVLVANQLDPTR
jgi:CheY-like chemotaxis protein